MGLNGWLNIDKPPGMTSYQVIARLKRLTGRCRIGHAGTLDPLATGVLPVAIGRATRTVEFLHQVSKTYRAVIEFGVTTDTYDAEGAVTARADASNIDRSAVEAALKSFVGKIEQVPPIYSALKQNGRPMYDMARRGEAVEVKARPVTIHCLILVDFASPLVTIDVECGGGTYIRSLAYDLGQGLGVGAHLKSLRRTRYGIFDITQSIPLDNLSSPDDLAAVLLPVDTALAALPSLELDEPAAAKVICGVVTEELSARLTGKQAYRLYRTDGELLAVADTAGEELRLKVFIAHQPGAESAE
ncbi:tRNA pseudouridine(55) synthase TruB [Dehalogenimonas sp. THU2]|uniref:tRNA pseudouridine(55) synthase TruB n=1 Tax=Dehalogenimonas sp. THU2 TaxID=3151121 RepID=UPI003218C30A